MKNKENTMKAHNAIAKKYYEEYKNDVTDLYYIDKFLEKCKNKVLDLGCGMGHYSRYIKEKGFDVVGVDFSEEMLKIARENEPSIKFIESDICNLPIEFEKDFDGVLLAYVIQYLSKEEFINLLKNIKKHLNKDANLLILFREGNNILEETEPFDNTYTYIIKEYTEKEITNILKESGYIVNEIIEKPFIEDENSLCPKTLVLYANNKV